jgi:hypothetical protein
LANRSGRFFPIIITIIAIQATITPILIITQPLHEAIRLLQAPVHLHQEAAEAAAAEVVFQDRQDSLV